MGSPDIAKLADDLDEDDWTHKDFDGGAFYECTECGWTCVGHQRVRYCGNCAGDTGKDVRVRKLCDTAPLDAHVRELAAGIAECRGTVRADTPKSRAVLRVLQEEQRDA